MSTTHDSGTFVVVSNTTAKICCLDSQGKPAYPWQESGQQAQGSVNWLRNGKAFLTTQGGSVAIHVLDTLKEKAPTILSLPAGPLLARVSGDGKCLILVQSGIPGAVHVYDMQSLLGSTGASVPAKPPVVLQDHDRPILALAASASTTHIASSNAAGSVYLHEAGSGARSTLGALPGGPALMTPKRCLAFSQLNKPLRLAAGADDGQVLVWQISPTAPGPVALPTKLRGRVMGVGFAAYNRAPSSVLLSCSESGQLSVVDMRNFPNVQAGFSVEMNVAVSCMTVRDDGQLVAVGTKDGRVGVLKVDDLLTHKQNLTKAGLIKVFDLGTHLDVADVAFQRVRESRESRDIGRERESRDSLSAGTPAPALAAEPAAAQPAPQEAADGRQGIRGVAEQGAGSDAGPPLKKATNHYAPVAGAQRQSLQGKEEVQAARAVASTAGPVASGPSQRQQPGSLLSAAGAAGATTRPLSAVQPAAAATGPSTQSAPNLASAAPGTLQSQPGRQPAVPAIVIPGMAPPILGHRRPSDVGGSNTPSAGSGIMEEASGLDGQAQPSPAARTLIAGAVAGGSPASSPSRPRSPRATLSAGGFPPSRLPLSSSGGDSMSASGLRSYLDDFRQEMRDLVRGLQADMVRQAVASEMTRGNDVAVLQQENRQLREEVQRLSQQLDAALRFGMLGQQRTPW